MWDDQWNRYDMHGSGSMVWLGVFVMVLLTLAVLAVLASLFVHLNPRRLDATAPAAPAEREARRLLDRRLALGEITVEEYASVRAALESEDRH